jgi:prepilin-type N-terminal cleavage/methylation domain-containing protein
VSRAISRVDAGSRTQSGLTLVELMIAMTILSIAIAAAFSIGYSMINGYRESRKVVAVERSARGALSFISAAVRSASAGVETGDITDVVGCNTWKGIEVVNEVDAPDEVRVVYASGAVVTTLRTAISETTTSLIVADGSEFSAGDRVLVIEPGVKGHLMGVAAVTDNGDGTWRLGLTGTATTVCPSTPVFTYAANSLVLRAKLAHFFIDESGSLPMLMMDSDGVGATLPEPIAEGIEDLQIAVAVDADSDDTTTEVGAAADDDEWFYNFDGDADPPSVIATPWRAVRITVSARSMAETPGLADSVRPAVEDRVSGATGDRFRRRSLSTTVEIRNLRGSP